MSFTKICTRYIRSLFPTEEDKRRTHDRQEALALYGLATDARKRGDTTQAELYEAQAINLLSPQRRMH